MDKKKKEIDKESKLKQIINFFNSTSRKQRRRVKFKHPKEIMNNQRVWQAIRERRKKEKRERYLKRRKRGKI